MRTRDDEGLDDDDRKVLDDIENVGWHMVGVPEDDQGPGFVYSIGLYRHPEVVVMGMNMDVMFHVVQQLGEWARDGNGVRAGDLREGLLEGFACTFRPVDRRWYEDYFGYALWFYRADDFPVLQCVWPDRAGHWPWDAGFNPKWKPKQPVLE
jgi:hypothetical protein